MRRTAIVFAAAATTLLSLTATAAAGAAHGCAADPVTSYTPVPSTDNPFGVTQGPGGTWYADGDLVVQVNADRQRAFDLPGDADAGWLAWDGRSSSIWFADRAQGRIGTVDGRGRITEYQVPDGVNGTSVPHGFVLGPGQYVWFTDFGNGRIGRLNLATAKFTFYDTPTADSGTLGLVRGTDGALYFTERNVDQVGSLAPDGTFREWSLDPGSFPNRIVVGPDGNIWFTELFGGKLGRIDSSGTLTEYPIDGGPVGITTGPDGQLYVALWTAAEVARVDTSGTVTATWSVPGALQVGSSRNAVWATDPFADSVAQVRVLCGTD
jgi:streptogramin lyase